MNVTNLESPFENFEEQLPKTREEIVQRLKNYENGGINKAMILADMMGADIEKDPVGFMLGAELWFYGGLYADPFFDLKDNPETADPKFYYRQNYSEVMKRVKTYVPMTGTAFYKKYGDQVWQIWNAIDGPAYFDYCIANTDNPNYEREVIECGEKLKKRIMITIAGDFLEELGDKVGEYLGFDVNDAIKICGTSL